MRLWHPPLQLTVKRGNKQGDNFDNDYDDNDDKDYDDKQGDKPGGNSDNDYDEGVLDGEHALLDDNEEYFIGLIGLMYFLNILLWYWTTLNNVPINSFKEKLSLECLLKFLRFSCSSPSHLCSSSAFFCTETFHWSYDVWEMFDMSSFKYFKPTKF